MLTIQAGNYLMIYWAWACMVLTFLWDVELDAPAAFINYYIVKR